jgi:hypothetical protein
MRDILYVLANAFWLMTPAGLFAVVSAGAAVMFAYLYFAG